MGWCFHFCSKQLLFKKRQRVFPVSTLETN
jgi:hypothetical protein